MISIGTVEYFGCGFGVACTVVAKMSGGITSPGETKSLGGGSSALRCSVYSVVDRFSGT